MINYCFAANKHNSINLKTIYTYDKIVKAVAWLVYSKQDDFDPLDNCLLICYLKNKLQQLT